MRFIGSVVAGVLVCVIAVCIAVTFIIAWGVER